jgi:hypothetical protein
LSRKSRPNLKSCSTKEEEESVAVSLAASKRPCPKTTPKINTIALDSQALCMYQRYGEAHERSTADLEFQHTSIG